MFDFPLIKGDPQTALNDPYALLISERMSDKYFPGEDPVGKSLILYGDRRILIFNSTSSAHLASIERIYLMGSSGQCLRLARCLFYHAAVA